MVKWEKNYVKLKKIECKWVYKLSCKSKWNSSNLFLTFRGTLIRLTILTLDSG